jgi:phosphoglycolate phosphatase-like HAD superfamily hydrolase
MVQPSLAILDIDGTLTDTTVVDDECFRQAMALALGVPSSEVDWTDAPHITDAGICHWLFERHRHQPATVLQVATAKAEFLRLLEYEAVSRPHRFRPVPGATGVLSYLAHNGWAVALATGAWGASARIKLAAAGISAGHIPLSCSDDASTRLALLRLAVDRAVATFSQRFHHVVSVGDGLWDLHAAAAADVGFVGIGSGSRAAVLRAHGASVVLTDWTDLEAANAALTRAAVPRKDAPSSAT